VIGRLLRLVHRQNIPLPEPAPDGVAVVRGAWIPRLGGLLSGMREPAAAVTIGSTIIVHPRVQLSPRLLRHELAHVAQWRRQPFSFPLRYLLNHLRYGYTNNPFEVEARSAEHSVPRPN
jgi:hypothetical protein